MVEPRESSHPPSDPGRSGKRAGGVAVTVGDRGGRVQFGAAIVLGVVLVAVGLYFWRRPRARDAGATEAASASASALAWDDAGGPPASAAAGPPAAVVLGDPRIIGCHDKGAKRTLPEDCDHVPAIEKALASAIEHAATCVNPPDSSGTASVATERAAGGSAAAGGTIEYVVSVSFSRHRVRVRLPRAGRSVQSRKTVRACGAAVREAVQSTPLDGIEHAHAQYDISITATYRGKAEGGSRPN